MKYCLITLIVLGIYSSAIHAQDLIVIDNGDSLNCKITQIKKDFIYFTFRHGEEIRNTLLPVGQVKTFKKDFYTTTEVPLEKVKGYKGNYTKFRVGAFGGWSYVLAKISSDVPSDFHQYMKELKSGYHLGGDFTYFTSENIGFGLKYSIFKTKNELDNIYATNYITGETRIGKLKDDITVQYFGPSFVSRISSANKKTNFTTALSLGYLAYKNKATIIDDFTLTGATVGMRFDLGVDIVIEQNISLYLGAGVLFGGLTQYTYSDGIQTKVIKFEDGKGESLSRIDLSIGLRWYK